MRKLQGLPGNRKRRRVLTPFEELDQLTDQSVYQILNFKKHWKKIKNNSEQIEKLITSCKFFKYLDNGVAFLSNSSLFLSSIPFYKYTFFIKKVFMHL